MSNLTTLYMPPNLTLWQGRADAQPHEYFYQIIKPLNLKQPEFKRNKTQAQFAILGFACDIGVKRNHGRPGAAQGPDIIKQALARLPIHKEFELYDAGTITAIDDELENAQQALATAVLQLLKFGLFPIIIGGGHETAWGHYQGLIQHFKTSLPILNFDAHFDLRDLPQANYGTSGTPFQQIALWAQAQKQAFDYSCIGIQNAGNTKILFERAQTYGVKTLLADDIHAQGTPAVNTFVAKLLKRVDKLYVTLCLDVLSCADAPGVSAPQPFGLYPAHILPSLCALAASGKLVSLDLVEYAPCYDTHAQTARLAAIFIHQFIHHFNFAKE